MHGMISRQRNSVVKETQRVVILYLDYMKAVVAEPKVVNME